MNITNFEQKRHFSRISFCQPVDCQMKEAGSVQGSLSKDISESGICLNYPNFVPLQTSMMLKIRKNDGAVIQKEGRVVRVERIAYSDFYKLGIKFDSVGRVLAYEDRL